MTTNQKPKAEKIKPLFEDMFNHKGAEDDVHGLKRAMMHQENAKAHVESKAKSPDSSKK